MDFAIALDNQSSEPIYRQLYEELRRAILTGRLSPKEKLPSTRSLAKSLHISRTTVTQCYEQLIGEGYLQTSVGSGTFVNPQLPDDLDAIAIPEAIDLLDLTDRSLKLSKYGLNVASMDLPGFQSLDSPISFRYGQPALDKFPFAIWKKLFARHCGSNLDLLDYSLDLLGHKPLRVAIANRLKTTRGVNCEADRILITNGSQQAIDLVTRLLIDPGDAIALEDPGYLGARRTFTAQKAQLIFIPVDDCGVDVKRLIDIPKVKFIYLTPSHQFPTGAVLSLSRRLELLNWARETGTIIVEDDYDSEYRYTSRPIPALQGLSPSIGHLHGNIQ
jgi:GntR family transcriptional regulator / MocR family aminotransferase